MAKKTDEELVELYLQKAKQAQNRIKRKENIAKEKQRKKENSIKFVLGGVLFKYFGDELKDLSRKEYEAFARGLDNYLANYENSRDTLFNVGKRELTEYQSKDQDNEE